MMQQVGGEFFGGGSFEVCFRDARRVLKRLGGVFFRWSVGKLVGNFGECLPIACVADVLGEVHVHQAPEYAKIRLSS